LIGTQAPLLAGTVAHDSITAPDPPPPRPAEPGEPRAALIAAIVTILQEEVHDAGEPRSSAAQRHATADAA
jgi:hypothetical protein